VRLPLASGLLGGKMTAATTFAASDHRKFNADGQKFNVGETFAGLPFAKGVALADASKPLVPAGMTLPELALRWCLDFEAASVLIPGAKNPEQARANTRAAALPQLSAELHAKLAEFYTRDVARRSAGRIEDVARRLSFSHAPLARRRLPTPPAQRGDGAAALGLCGGSGGGREEALWLAESNRDDLVSLDRMLPKLDGLEVLRRLRAAGRDTHVLPPRRATVWRTASKASGPGRTIIW